MESSKSVYTVVEKSAEDVLADVELYRPLAEIYAESFPGEVSFRKSIPDAKSDRVFIAYGKKGVPSGFVMIHPVAPYKFTKVEEKETPYMFNLCVSASQRRKGVASALLAHAQGAYKCLTCHIGTFDRHHEWFARRGWQRLDVWRGKYTEYVHASRKLDAKPAEPYVLDNYDPDENVVYAT